MHSESHVASAFARHIQDRGGDMPPARPPVPVDMRFAFPRRPWAFAPVLRHHKVGACDVLRYEGGIVVIRHAVTGREMQLHWSEVANNHRWRPVWPTNEAGESGTLPASVAASGGESLPAGVSPASTLPVDDGDADTQRPDAAPSGSSSSALFEVFTSRSEWLAARPTFLGASEAGKVLAGKVYGVWAAKCLPREEDGDTDAAAIGRGLEDAVLKLASDMHGWGADPIGYTTWRHPERRWMACTPDGTCGPQAGVEVKTRGNNSDFPYVADGEVLTIAPDTRLWDDEPKSDWAARDRSVFLGYLAQCYWSIEVTGADRWYLAVLMGGRGFHLRCYEVLPSPEDQQALIGAASAFWHDHVVTKTPPPVNEGDLSADGALARLFVDAEGVTDLDTDAVAALHAYKAAGADERQAKAAKSWAKARVRRALGEAKFGRYEGPETGPREAYINGNGVLSTRKAKG